MVMVIIAIVLATLLARPVDAQAHEAEAGSAADRDANVIVSVQAAATAAAAVSLAAAGSLARVIKVECLFQDRERENGAQRWDVFHRLWRALGCTCGAGTGTHRDAQVQIQGLQVARQFRLQIKTNIDRNGLRRCERSVGNRDQLGLARFQFFLRESDWPYGLRRLFNDGYCVGGDGCGSRIPHLGCTGARLEIVRQDDVGGFCGKWSDFSCRGARELEAKRDFRALAIHADIG